jgi:hypothetical protein
MESITTDRAQKHLPAVASRSITWPEHSQEVTMRPFAFAVAIALALPTLASAAQPITTTDALDTTQSLAAKVGGYSARHAGEPGAFAPWADAGVTTGGPILIHSYPALEPSYYYVPLRSETGGAGSFVTVDAVTGDWQAFGRQRTRSPFPAVGRTEAAALAGTELGVAVSPDQLRAVSMPNKHIYWYWSDASGARALEESGAVPSREFFINTGDPSDVHRGPDEEISPPQSRHGAIDDSPDIDDGAPRAARSDQRFPSSYDISSVPHYYQLTSYDCGPASAEMVMDYYGADITQGDISDVANAVNPSGCYTDDLRRTGHFSAISSAAQNGSLWGYDERKLGYGSMENRWSYPTSGTDPDYADRYNDLKDLISSDFPIIPLTWYDSNHNSGHYRVVKGYNDSTNVFIVHDPWYTGTYQGPDVNFNQTFFVDNLWTNWYHWALFMCPWEVQVDCPSDVIKGATFTVDAIVYYHGPHPFEGQDPASSRTVTIDTSPLFSLAPGEVATQSLPGSAASGIGNLVSWQVVADTVELGNVISVRAEGYISDSCTSYGSYADSIGGWGSKGVTIWDPSMIFVDWQGTGDFSTIQEGLDSADSGDTVVVLPGTYSGTGNLALDFGGKSVLLTGAAGPESTIIDCQSAGRAFEFTSGEGPGAVIEGFTITAGRAPGTSWPDNSGGGVYLDGASPTIRDVTIRDCTCENAGGGVLCMNGSSPLFEDVEIVGNMAETNGGGGMLCYDSSHPSLVRVGFHGNNSANQGGGLWCYAGCIAGLEYCTFADNATGFDGGAIDCGDGSNVSIVNCTLVHNLGGNSGGIGVYASSPQITNTIIAFSDNGSAVLCSGGGSNPSFSHCAVYGNAGGDSLCGTYAGQSNVFTDPALCDELGGAHYLQEGSPCEGTGTGGCDIGAWPVNCPAGDPTGLDEPLPTALRLHPARPSPFSGRTELRLDVPAHAGRVELAIYNVRGQLVRTLATGGVEPGRRVFAWDGTDDIGRPVASGIYFARCRCDEGTAARKVVLMR